MMGFKAKGLRQKQNKYILKLSKSPMKNRVIRKKILTLLSNQMMSYLLSKQMMSNQTMSLHKVCLQSLQLRLFKGLNKTKLPPLRNLQSKITLLELTKRERRKNLEILKREERWAERWEI